MGEVRQRVMQITQTTEMILSFVKKVGFLPSIHLGGTNSKLSQCMSVLL